MFKNCVAFSACSWTVQGAGLCNAAETGEAYPGWFTDARRKTSDVYASPSTGHLYKRQ